MTVWKMSLWPINLGCLAIISFSCSKRDNNFTNMTFILNLEHFLVFTVIFLIKDHPPSTPNIYCGNRILFQQWRGRSSPFVQQSRSIVQNGIVLLLERIASLNWIGSFMIYQNSWEKKPNICNSSNCYFKEKIIITTIFQM